MELIDPKANEAPLAILIGIQFDLLTSEDIQELSVFGESQPILRVKELSDARLGLPAHEERCFTCFSSKRDDCPGHFGHYNLSTYVYHPEHVRSLQQMLNKICPSCGKLKKRKKELKKEFCLASLDGGSYFVTGRKANDISMARPSLMERCNASQSQKWSERIMECGTNKEKTRAALARKCKSISQDVHVCADQQYIPMNAKLKWALRSKASSMGSLCKGRNSILKNAKDKVKLQEAQMQSGKCCKYCRVNASEDHVEYPVLTFKVVKKEVDNQEISTIEMEANLKSISFPSDFWGFVDRLTDVDGPPRLSRPLLPIEALKILKRVPKDSLKELGIVSRPEACILRCLPIPPNCMRVIEKGEYGNPCARRGFSQRTQKLALVLAKSNTFKTGRTDTTSLYAAQNEACKLQAVIKDYLKSSKIVADEEEQPLYRRKYCWMKGRMKQGPKSHPKWFKKNILGKRSDYSARCLLSGDPFIDIEELAIPHTIARKLHVPERVTCFNWVRLKGYLDNGTEPKAPKIGVERVVRDGQSFKLYRRRKPWKLEIGDAVYRQLKDGDLVFANRLPSIHHHSLIAFKVKIINRLTFGINPLICAPFSADFDGDALHVFVPQSAEARVEASEFMTVPQQMICSQGGQALIGLSQDSLLAAYLLLNSGFLFNRDQVERLYMFCIGAFQKPAIIKAPQAKGPLWTGVQLFSMTLPAGLKYENATEKVVIRDSELLQCYGESSWLQNSTDGLVKSICSQAGPCQALRFLNCAQMVLQEWIMEHGFSVGLHDVYLTDDLKSRQKMMEEINAGIMEAKQSSQKAFLLFHSDIQQELAYCKQDVSSANCLRHIAEGELSLSSGNKSFPLNSQNLQNTAIEEFQRVFADIEKVVTRYIAPRNSLLAMVKAGSKGSMSKLIQQSACIGLQLVEGERRIFCEKSSPDDFWKHCGLVNSSFWEGLNASDFFSHALSVRSLAKNEVVNEPGKLFRDSMFCLRELYVAYDGTVRKKSGQHVIQFSYGGIRENDCNHAMNNDEPSKHSRELSQAVGALAATAVTEPAYNIALDNARMNKNHPLHILKATMSRGSSSKLNKFDHCVTLRIAKSAIKHPSDMERAALRIKGHLRCVKLEMLASSTMIEYNNLNSGDDRSADTRWSPWIGHVQLSEAAARRENLTVNDILKVLTYKFSEVKDQHLLQCLFSSREDCHCTTSFCIQEGRRPCIQFLPALPLHIKADEEKINDKNMSELLSYMKFRMLPTILNSVVRGNFQIKSAVIKWEESVMDNRNMALHKKFKDCHDQDSFGELVVQICTIDVPEHGMSWNIVKDACLGIMNTIDWRRSEPYSIAEVCHVLGIEAARKCILERLKLSMNGMGRHIDDKHLFLIADYMTHTGNVLPFTAAGFREWHRKMSDSAPFTQGSFAGPKDVFFNAARRNVFDDLSGTLASLVWGKDLLGNNLESFDLLWAPKEEPGSRLKDSDICGFLNSVHEEILAAVPGAAKEHMPSVNGSGILYPLKNCNSEEEYLQFPPGFEPHKIQETDEHISTESNFTVDKDATEWNEILRLAYSIQKLLHHQYQVGDELVGDDKRLVLEEVLPHHPNSDVKIGCGIAAIQVGHNENFPNSRCFILVRMDGSRDDFSYRKCLEGIARCKSSALEKKYKAKFLSRCHEAHSTH